MLEMASLIEVPLSAWHTKQCSIYVPQQGVHNENELPSALRFLH